MKCKHLDCEVIAENERLKDLSNAMCDMNRDTIDRGFELIIKLQAEVELLKADNPKFAQFLKRHGIVQGDDGEVECVECHVWLRLKEVEGAGSDKKLFDYFNDKYPDEMRGLLDRSCKTADILRKGE